MTRDSRRSPSPLDLSGLIGAIYDCALDPDLWDATLGAIAALVGSERVILSLNDTNRDRILIVRSVGWEPAWLEERERHAAEIHAAMAGWLAAAPGAAFVASQDVPVAYLATSPYVRAVLVPLGIVDIAHFLLIRTPQRFSELVVARQGDRGVFAPGDIELGQLLAPHLRRALTINDVLDVTRLERQALHAALDRLALGVFIVGGDGRILHANAAAGDMLSRRSPLLSSGGRLVAQSSEATQEIAHAITLAGSDEAEIGACGLGVPLPADDGTGATAHVLPLARGTLRPRLLPQATAAVFVVPGRANRSPDLATVTRLLGLTPAEARHLEHLVAGATLADSAAALQVSVATARTHREHIFLKAGVSRHAELLKLVEGLVPPLR